MRNCIARVLKKDGSFLLESMIGTAILGLVMVFFATVSVSAFLLMQRAYLEAEVSEEVFRMVESRNYSSLVSTEQSPPAGGGKSFTLDQLNETGIYVAYTMTDGTKGTLNNWMLGSVSLLKLRGNELYTFAYKGSKGEYSATYFVLKGEK